LFKNAAHYRLYGLDLRFLEIAIDAGYCSVVTMQAVPEVPDNPGGQVSLACARDTLAVKYGASRLDPNVEFGAI